MPFEQCPVGEPFGANVANPVTNGAMNVLLVNFQLRQRRVRNATDFARVRLAFLVQMAIHVGFQEVLLNESIAAYVAFERSLRNGRVDKPTVVLQAVTIGEGFVAKFTAEVIRVKVL